MVISGLSTAASIAASLCAVAGSVTVGVAAVYRWLSRLEKVVAVVEKRSQELTPGPAEGGQGEHTVSLRDDVSNILEQLVSNREELGEKINAVAAQLVQHMNAPLVHRCSECGPPGSACGGTCRQLEPPDAPGGTQPPADGPAGAGGTGSAATPAALPAPPSPRPPGPRWGRSPRS